MAVKIKLTLLGRISKPFYRIVASDQKTKRTGKALENLGYYDPLTQPFTLKVNREAVAKWIKNGAQMTETVRKLLTT
ncbi:30S ribosomal protein S16 [Candidatus Gottesmanbacteria bacterium RIFCSPHIGHO2_02_FULL_40_13]|uniref:Small ribosomal subunit protein bS16 n=1 Tax=Candidatus Gottesmanbacteria bacterium RIFCSPHIGHO2_02_FULL_40_13 TaxID=1798384 RepID=A0A1F6A7U1_9BACT|nr:MAG: 30S ribosomal protein S16 [Candidatus Gottesmanbacteria bacterium RIFCSPHIGHO2_02_FULL_40_13]